jgi:hypothetical protein
MAPPSFEGGFPLRRDIMHDKWSDIVDTMLPGTYGWKQVDRGSLDFGQFFRLTDNNGQMMVDQTYIAVDVSNTNSATVIEKDGEERSIINDLPLTPTIYVPFMFGMFDDVYEGCWLDVGFDFVETFK